LRPSNVTLTFGCRVNAALVSASMRAGAASVPRQYRAGAAAVRVIAASMRVNAAVNAFTPITNPKPITDSHRVVWRRERATADAAGFRANEVVLMDIFHADGQMSMTIPMQISAGLKELVAEWITDGFAKPTDVDPTGKMTRDPCTYSQRVTCFALRQPKTHETEPITEHGLPTRNSKMRGPLYSQHESTEHTPKGNG
jgi:hypothetical protein